jgi:hypothetical protein
VDSGRYRHRCAARTHRLAAPSGSTSACGTGTERSRASTTRSISRCGRRRACSGPPATIAGHQVFAAETSRLDMPAPHSDDAKYRAVLARVCALCAGAGDCRFLECVVRPMQAARRIAAPRWLQGLAEAETAREDGASQTASPSVSEMQPAAPTTCRRFPYGFRPLLTHEGLRWYSEFGLSNCSLLVLSNSDDEERQNQPYNASQIGETALPRAPPVARVYPPRRGSSCG